LLVWITSALSIALTFVISYLLIPILGGNAAAGTSSDPTLWWKLSAIITCGTLAGAVIPELVKVFTSTESAHVREVVTSSREGGASLNILSGLTAEISAPTGWDGAYRLMGRHGWSVRRGLAR